MKLKNAIINTERVNKELKKLNIPIRMKAGMIGMLSVKVSSQLFIFSNYSRHPFSIYSLNP